MAQLIPPFLASAFERLGAGNKALEQVAINTGQTAASVSVGGDLYKKMDELVNALKSSGGGGKGKVSIKEALVLRITAGALKPVGLGLGIIIDALERAPEGKELKLKMEALTNGLLALGDIGWAILKFAGMMILATPLLLVAGVAALIWVPMIRLMIDGLMWATKKLDEKGLQNIIALGDVGKALLILSASLVLMALLTPLILKGLLVAGAVLLGFGLMLMLLGKMGLDTKHISKFGKALGHLGKSLFVLSLTLVLMGLLTQPILIGLGTAALVLLTIGGVFWLLDFMDVEKSIRKTGIALMFAAGAILSLSIALVLSHLILSGIGFKEVAKVMLVVGGVALLFGLIAKKVGDIRKASIGLILAAGAILALTIAIYLMNLILPDMSGKDILNTFIVLAVIAAVAFVFYLAGQRAKDIKKGAKAMIYAAGAMISLAVGVWAMNKALEGVTWEKMLMMGAVVAGLAIAMSLAGEGPNPKFIKKGSISMMIAGVALVVLAIGTKIFMKALEGVTWENLGMMAAIIVGVGAAFAVAGIPPVALAIAIGAGAMILAGAALIVIGKGVAEMNKLPIQKMFVKGGLFGDSGTVTKGFLGIGGGRPMTNMEVMFEAIANSFSLGPLQIAALYVTSPALIMAGLALITIGKGLQEFQKIAAETDLILLGVNVSLVTTVLADAFGKIGKKFPGGAAGLFSSGSFVAQGISSVKGMGGALTGIAIGMQNMANLKFPVKYDKEGKPIEFESMDSSAPIRVAANAAMITGVLAEVFGKIGKKYPGGKKSLFAQILTGKGNSPVADGISSVQGMGGALTGIAKGFQSMANLKFPVEWDKEGNPIKFEKIDIATNLPMVMANTWMIVNGISGVFGELGKNPDAQSKGWFGKSTIQKGIDLVTGVGTPLVNLAQGVQNMANLKFPTGFDKDGKATGYETLGSPEDLMTKVTGNTKLLIRALVEVFTEIGQDQGTNDGYYWWSASSFEKGRDIVASIAEPYKKLGEALKEVIGSVGKLDTVTFAGKMSDILKVFVGAGQEDTDTKELNFKKLYVNALGSSFEKMKTAVPAIVNAANSFNEKKGTAFFSALMGPTDKGKRAEGYNSQKILWNAIGHSMVKTSESMPGISQAINSMDLEKLVEARTMFEALGVLAHGGSADDILSKIGESLETAMEKLATILQEFKQTVKDNPPTNPPTNPPKGDGTGTGKNAPIQFPTTMNVVIDKSQWLTLTSATNSAHLEE